MVGFACLLVGDAVRGGINGGDLGMAIFTNSSFFLAGADLVRLLNGDVARGSSNGGDERGDLEKNVLVGSEASFLPPRRGLVRFPNGDAIRRGTTKGGEDVVGRGMDVVEDSGASFFLACGGFGRR